MEDRQQVTFSITIKFDVVSSYQHYGRLMNMLKNAIQDITPIQGWVIETKEKK